MSSEICNQAGNDYKESEKADGHQAAWQMANLCPCDFCHIAKLCEISVKMARKDIVEVNL